MRDTGDARILFELRRLAELSPFAIDDAKLLQQCAQELDIPLERAERVAEKALASEKGVKQPEPLFDFDAGLVAPLLDRDPPRRRMLVEGFLPANEVGAVAAAGGTGKGWFLLQLAVSIATGLPFFGLGVVEAGEVLILSAEDRRDEVHRRLHEIVRRAEQVGLIVDRGLLGSRLSVISRVGDENLLTTLGPEGEMHRTKLVDRFLLSLRGREHLKLVVFDPTSRFRGGHENSSEHTTRYVEVLEHVREETRGFVLTSTHVNKFGVKEGGGAEMVRGSSALVDNVRWVLTMQRLRPDQASEYDVEPGEASRYTRIDLPKTNYTSGWPGMWTRRESGVLVPCELKRVANGAKRAKADEQYDDVLGRLVTWFEEEGPQSKRAIKEAAGQTGPLGAGKDVVLSVLHRALAQDALTQFDGNVGRTNGRPYPAAIFGTPAQKPNDDAK